MPLSLVGLDLASAFYVRQAGKHGAPRLVSTQEGGRTYALPFTTVTLHQFFNPDLLREYGFVKGDAPTPPETWDERREMARRMTDRTRDRWGNAHYSYAPDQGSTTDFMQWVMQNGVEWMNKDLTKFTFNTPEGIETMQYLYDMVWKDQSTIPPGYVTEKPRETNRVALWTEGAWLIPGYRTTAPDMMLPRSRTGASGLWDGSSAPASRRVRRRRERARERAHPTVRERTRAATNARLARRAPGR